MLIVSIGLPFVLLSATSPLAQVWYARTSAEREPYHLFSLSNVASLLALLSYPLLIEPLTILPWQFLPLSADWRDSPVRNPGEKIRLQGTWEMLTEVRNPFLTGRESFLPSTAAPVW